MTVEARRVAIVLELDDVAAVAVRQISESIALSAANAGVSVASVPPHVTLAVCRNLDVEGFRAPLAQVAVQTQVVATVLAAVGVFASVEGVVFLIPTISHQLVEVHLGTLRHLQDLGAEVEPYWQPLQWVPHCTLATGIPREHVSTAVGRAYEVLHPIAASLTRLSAIEIESPRLLYTFDLSG